MHYEPIRNAFHLFLCLGESFQRVSKIGKDRQSESQREKEERETEIKSGIAKESETERAKQSKRETGKKSGIERIKLSMAKREKTGILSIYHCIEHPVYFSNESNASKT